MKKILMIAGIFLPLFLLGGCRTEEQKTETKFEADLRSLYAKVQSFGTQTRAEGGGLLTEEQFVEVFNEVNTIWQEYGICKVVDQSGYYTGGLLDLATADVYDILQWVEVNGTHEFYNLMLLSKDELTLNQIIASENLLPNETVALVAILAVISNDIIHITRAYPSSNEACYTAYVNARGECMEQKGKLSFAVALLAPEHYQTVNNADIAEWNRCLDSAEAAFQRCVQQ